MMGPIINSSGIERKVGKGLPEDAEGLEPMRKKVSLQLAVERPSDTPGNDLTREYLRFERAYLTDGYFDRRRVTSS